MVAGEFRGEGAREGGVGVGEWAGRQGWWGGHVYDWLRERVASARIFFFHGAFAPATIRTACLLTLVDTLQKFRFLFIQRLVYLNFIFMITISAYTCDTVVPLHLVYAPCRYRFLVEM